MPSNYSNKIGLAPGTLTYVGRGRDHNTKITVIEYDPENFSSKEIKDVKELQYNREQSSITWINLDGVHNMDLIHELGSIFDIHPLLQEDVVNTNHRPKLDEHDDQIYFTLQMFLENEKTTDLRTEQISIIAAKNYVISFQETPQDIFDQVRERIKSSKGRIRDRGTDYLVYALVDTIVDGYFVHVDTIDQEISALENTILSGTTKSVLGNIQHLKKQLVLMRRIITPLREALGVLEKSELDLIDPQTRPFFRDVYDHILRVSDFIDSSREILNNAMDVFNSTVSNRMNQVIKILTIISTIFIPLTFIAGVYGMNFKYMPELELRWAYPAVLGLMSALFLGMVVYFKKSRWM